MPIHRTFASIALAACLGLSPAAMAQEHVIGGQAVPAEQVDAIQERCDELRYQQGTTGTQTPETTMTEAPATDPVTADPGAQSGAIDIETLTLTMCDEGGFAASEEAN
ncbi:hypothetical protein FF80_02441 [Devosia sp. LC5]|uniref:hypothetical protein n=1 Tax=Devosia sp. LC5 TaxID=1502724 RepID=UPI0004E2E045|nr:hypothetical protein [Devosia sp. LC5]KFC66674.1 hypothetical protein FF80_02441 [Devosia sp. LC5]